MQCVEHWVKSMLHCRRLTVKADGQVAVSLAWQERWATGTSARQQTSEGVSSTRTLVSSSVFRFCVWVAAEFGESDLDHFAILPKAQLPGLEDGDKRCVPRPLRGRDG